MKDCCEVFIKTHFKFCPTCGNSLRKEKPEVPSIISELGWATGFDPKGQYCKFIDCDARKKINEIIIYLIGKNK